LCQSDGELARGRRGMRLKRRREFQRRLGLFSGPSGLDGFALVPAKAGRLKLDPGSNSLQGLLDFFALSEGAQSEVTLPGGPEAGPRGADHVAFVQKLVEKSPGIEAARRLEPDVGGMDPSEYLQTR